MNKISQTACIKCLHNDMCENRSDFAEYLYSVNKFCDGISGSPCASRVEINVECVDFMESVR